MKDIEGKHDQTGPNAKLCKCNKSPQTSSVSSCKD